MKIKLSPIRIGGAELVIDKLSENILIVNGIRYDFSPMKEGDELPISAISGEVFVDFPVRFINGELEVTMQFPLPANYSPEQAYPADLVNVPDGSVALPQPLPEEEKPIIEVSQMEANSDVAN